VTFVRQRQIDPTLSGKARDRLSHLRAMRNNRQAFKKKKSSRQIRALNQVATQFCLFVE
jgi:hypothetical protein